MKKIKFKHETKKGQIVYLISLNIFAQDSAGKQYYSYKEGLFVEELKIVHQTNHKIVLSDPYVTLLDRKKEADRSESYRHFLDDINVSVKTKETYFPNGIFCNCYTTESPEKIIKSMKHKIIIKINKEYGFLRDMDLERKIYDLELI